MITSILNWFFMKKSNKNIDLELDTTYHSKLYMKIKTYHFTPII